MLTEFIFYELCYLKRKLTDFQRTLSFESSLGLLLNRSKSFAADFVDSIWTPIYSIRDVDILRQITTNDFDYFEYRFEVASVESECEKIWHDMEAVLILAFTSTRMRQMFELVVECTEDMVEHLNGGSKQSTPIQWEMTELFSRYSSDVAASAVGLKVNSFKHPTNDFYTFVTQNMNSNKVQNGFRSIIIQAIPKLICDLTFEFPSARAKRFFKLAVLEEVQDRETEEPFRPDMIDFMMQMRSGELKNQDYETSNANEMEHAGQIWTDDEIVAPCFQFFAGGLELSPIMSFISYKLAMLQDIQQQLYDEILETSRMLDGARIPYDSLVNLKFLDQVISETLRKFGFGRFNSIGMGILFKTE